MTAEELTLFDPEDLIEWVVEVDEIFLNAIGAQDREALGWWLLHSGRRGIADRTITLFVAPPGALLYVRCDDRDQAEWLAGFLVEKGLHVKGVTVRQVGRLITCKGCGERRPFWATTRRGGRRCRPCWNERMRISWPGGVDVVCVENKPLASATSPQATAPVAHGAVNTGSGCVHPGGRGGAEPLASPRYAFDAENDTRSPGVNVEPGRARREVRDASREARTA